ncbi:hypothetical protein SAMD00019534_051590 [Acytostelium subglobosum LB1]|uniref:hypothetical protein n=1 Tax=Acytostelium subglobosum LB1 TaxID=1410327 RepID=UPI00064514A5|nr:hypothetical protein SAMD00019534_051590 [Acytostelium subglobosum LB1]GAM21984.1 hypothetical protein SAMD00019534_051590 [Acytostelium subglobosum LB1]|eukprot:XP_012755084.1 hypothetical protein SAMD00019534_051590 [Acytostelium subglobosum LB1]
MSAGKTAQAEEFDWAVKNGDLANVKASIDANPQIVKKLDGNQRNPCHWAADFGQTAVLELLITKKADFDGKDKYGITPLLAAIYENHAGAVALLLKHGANKNVTGPDGSTALEAATSEEVKALLK